MSSEKISAGLPKRPRRCPECGATIHNVSASKCWLCEAELAGLDTAIESAEERDLPRGIRRPEDSGPRVHVTILVFVVLFLAICVGLAMSAPGLLIVLLAAATPAIFSTALFSFRAQKQGEPRSGYAVIGMFLGTFLFSLAAIVLIVLAAIAALVAALFTICGMH